MKDRFKRFIKSLFCRHESNFYSNIYGDEINLFNARSWWKCSECGEFQSRRELGLENNGE